MERGYLDADELFGCPHRFLLNKIAEHSPILDAPADPIGVQHRREVADARTEHIYLELAEQPGAVLIDPGPTAVDDTLSAIRAGVPIICGATLPADPTAGRSSASCILLRSDTSAGGDDSDGNKASHSDGNTLAVYTPVITVNHKCYDLRLATAGRPPSLPLNHLSRPSLIPHTSPIDHWDPTPQPHLKLRHHTKDQLRLTHLWLLLRHAGIPTTGQGGIIDLRGEQAVVRWLDESLPNYQESFRERQELLTQMVTDIAPRAFNNLPTRPCRRAECHACAWWETRCEPELQQHQDVSLVVSAGQAAALAAENIHTIPQLAAPDVVEPDEWPGGSFPTAVALARAYAQGFTLLRKGPEPELPDVDVEIDIDMESVLDHGAYLWGTLLSYRIPEIAEQIAVTPGYRPFVTWEKLPHRSTAVVFVHMWRFVADVWRRAEEQGLTFRVYCYAQAGERHWIRYNVLRFPEQTGMPTEQEVRRLLNSDQWVDMFRVVDRALLGVHGVGLKKVAPVAGFNWRDEDPSGESSIAWHAQAVEPNIEVQQRILDYNEDDVRATKAVRDWLRSGDWIRDLPLRDDLY